MKKHRFLITALIRVENAPSPATIPYLHPPIFLNPSSLPSPSPSPSPSPPPNHSSLPKAAIVGGSVAGAVVALAVTSAVISTVAGKVGLSCILAPLLKILTSPFTTAVCSSGPCTKLRPLCCNLCCANGKGDGSDKKGPCASLDSLCSNLQWRNRRKDGPDKTPTDHNPDIELFVDVLGGRSPETVPEAGKTTASQYYSALAKSPIHDVIKAHGDQLRVSAQSSLTTQVSEIAEEGLEKQQATIMQILSDPSSLQDVIKAHGDRLGTSAESFLAAEVSNFVETELKKQKALIMQSLDQNVMKAQGYLESVNTATTDVDNELKAFQSSAHEYLDGVGKLIATAEHMGKPEVARLMVEEATIKFSTEKIKTSRIATEYAAEMKRLQKLKNEPLILDEEVVLNKVEAKTTPLGGRDADHHEEASNQYMDAEEHVGGSVPIVETLSDMSKLQDEMDAVALDRRRTDQQDTSRVALVPITSSAGSQQTPGPIVPVPTKAITPVTTTTMTSATAEKTQWQISEQGRKGKRPTNLGHVSCSCELSSLKLHFFSSCRSGGSYGSQHRSHVGNDPEFLKNNDYVEVQELNPHRHNNREISSYYNNTTAFSPISYGGNNLHLQGLSTSSNAPIKHCYNGNAQYFQPITNLSPLHQMALPSTSTNGSKSHVIQMAPPKTSIEGSNSHVLSDYGSPFDGVL
ncbi:hypothetical protein L7F22_028042 [Adiantum nelumboides]|nr:hypothetical protein [Adiantum nelumboides]